MNFQVVSQVTWILSISFNTIYWLVVSTPLKIGKVNLDDYPNIWKNKKGSKPPTSISHDHPRSSTDFWSFGKPPWLGSAGWGRWLVYHLSDLSSFSYCNRGSFKPIWLVVDLPPWKKIRVRQLGWLFHSQNNHMEKHKIHQNPCSSHHQPAIYSPTNGNLRDIYLDASLHHGTACSWIFNRSGIFWMKVTSFLKAGDETGATAVTQKGSPLGYVSGKSIRQKWWLFCSYFASLVWIKMEKSWKYHEKKTF